jgi:hypothetical protein
MMDGRIPQNERLNLITPNGAIESLNTRFWRHAQWWAQKVLYLKSCYS